MEVLPHVSLEDSEVKARGFMGVLGRSGTQENKILLQTTGNL